MKKKMKKKSTKKTRSEDIQSDEDTSDSGEDTDDSDEPSKKGRPASVSYEDFVKLWSTSGSVGDVAEALGVKVTSASAIASRLRRGGVELKKFPRRGSQPIDVKKLNKIAAGKGD